MIRLRSFVLATALVSASCAADDTPVNKPQTRLGDIRQADVWKNGLTLTGVIRIFEGAVVDIEPGASITCTEATQIQVGGVLRVRGGGEPAKISCASWHGILVAENGQLDVDGLNIENAEIGIETTRGAGACNVRNSEITNSMHPFMVGPSSVLTITKSKVTTSTRVRAGELGISEVRGSLVAKYLDYEANTSEGLSLIDGGEADIEDSTLKAKGGLDLVSSYGGKSLKLRYSTLRGAHCGPHLQDIETFEIDHVTSEDNSYGITIYGASVAGPHVIKDSNFAGGLAWLDLQGDHGPITFQNVFTSGNEEIKNTDPPTVTKATERIVGAEPRPSN